MPVPIICLDGQLRQFAERFREQFSKPQFKYFVIVLLGLVECEERKTMSGLLRWVAERISLSGLSRFLSKWPWSPQAVAHTWMERFRQRLDELVQAEHQRLKAEMPKSSGRPKATVVTGYLIFDDSVDIYWARSRVSERLARASSVLPEGIVPQMGPEGTGVGHVFWYLVKNDNDPNTPKRDLAELRSLQDWYIRYQLNSVPGVAQVASVGGFPIEYQIDVDPNKLRALGVAVAVASLRPLWAMNVHWPPSRSQTSRLTSAGM